MKLLLQLHTQIYLWLHLLNASTTRLDRATTDEVAAPLHESRRRTERGSVTIEQVIWAGAVIVIVGIVVAVITGYVTTQAEKIK